MPSNDSVDGRPSHDAHPLALAETAFVHWARTAKSWQRLGPLVDLALQGAEVPNRTSAATEHGKVMRYTTVADIGTDHGLLAVALAATRQFRVVGVDVSELALRHGAWALQRDMAAYPTGHCHRTDPLQLEFRHGNALSALTRGEADIVCMAGMGVYTMMDILTAPTVAEDAPRGLSSSHPIRLDELECRRLILQPTNSRPHLLMYLYDSLYAMGWTVRDERIELVSSRWYLTVALERVSLTESAPPLPGAVLAHSDDPTTRHEFARWVAHHCQWIRHDAAPKAWRPEDVRWMAHFASLEEQ